MFKGAGGFGKPRLGCYQMSIASVFYSCITNCHKISGLNYLTQFLWVRNLSTDFQKGAIQVSASQAVVSFQDSPGEGSISKLMWLSAEFKSLWLQSGLLFLIVSLRLPSVPCHRGPFKARKGGGFLCRREGAIYLMQSWTWIPTPLQYSQVTHPAHSHRWNYRDMNIRRGPP